MTMAQNRLPAILLTAFGASSAAARRAYDHIDAMVRQHCPEHVVHWAFTSQRVIARLRHEGVMLSTLDEASAQIRRDGFDRVVVLPLLTVAGEEYATVARCLFASMKAAVCRPLLGAETDIDEILRALVGEVRTDAANILVCHGNGKHDAYNDLLVELGDTFSAIRDCYAASVEGRPGTACFERAAEAARRTGRAHFVPFMVVAGEHITNDVMGDEPDSWRNRIAAQVTTCARSLGWNDAIVRLFLNRLDEGLARIEKEGFDGR